MSDFSFDATAIEATLGYRFVRPSLLQEALTHPTWINENRSRDGESKGCGHYERLEFLGDSVLGLLVSQHLLAAFPDEPEGPLSRRRAQLVCKEALAGAARAMGLAAFVRVGQGQKETGVADSILADVIEAILGAAFLDGGLVAVEAIFGGRLAHNVTSAGIDGARGDDKTELQELCHRRKWPAPRYQVVATFGPSHARVFRVRLDFAGSAALAPIECEGRSKKIAEQRCARQAHEALSERSASQGPG